jgi:hypothetical protein
MNDLRLTVNLKAKRIYIGRGVITLLGNPLQLGFWYDEAGRALYVSAAAKDDLDAFTIPNHFWKNKKHSCEVARIAFLKALQYRLGWEKDSQYAYDGILTEHKGVPSVVFNMLEGVRLK